jgi:hypothetical protein
VLPDRSQTWQDYTDVRARAEELLETKSRAYAASYADKGHAIKNDNAAD